MTPNYNYTEWIDKNDKLVSQMLFEAKTDRAENKNLANDPAQKATIDALSQQLRDSRGKNFLAPKK